MKEYTNPGDEIRDIWREEGVQLERARAEAEKKRALEQNTEKTIFNVIATMIDNGGDIAVIKSLLGVDIRTVPELWSRYQKRPAGGSSGVTKIGLD